VTETASVPAETVDAQMMRRFLETLRRTQFLPAEKILDYQRGLLERLLRHARAHVPFYRDTGRLDLLFRGDDTIAWERWAEVPVLTRNDVRQSAAGLRAEVLTPEHGGTWTMSTSGSTGEPVTVMHTWLSRSIGWTAVLLRDYERHGVDPTRRLAWLSPWDATKQDVKTIHRRDCWYPEFASLGLFGERYDIADTRNVRELVEVVISLRPDYLRIQPIVLDLMCANDSLGRLSDLGVGAITTVGEHLSNDAKARAEAHFRCRTIDHYGSIECGRMASTCPHCGRFHVHAEVSYVEVIDDNGKATRPGAVGQILATPLYNYAMPLIRYDHADQAEVGFPGGCPVTLPALNAVHGKERMPFKFPGGIVIRPTLPHDPVLRLLGAQSYQVAQVADDRCEFRLIAGTMTEAEMRFDEMTAVLRAMWWDGLQVDYRIVETFPRGNYGKLKLFVREMADAGTEDGMSQ
jgi:phenylacetate-CoA ligase